MQVAGCRLCYLVPPGHSVHSLRWHLQARCLAPVLLRRLVLRLAPLGNLLALRGTKKAGETIPGLLANPGISAENGPSVPLCPTTPGWNRTSDRRFRKPLLYPLSYGGGFACNLSSCRASRRGYASALRRPDSHSDSRYRGQDTKKSRRGLHLARAGASDFEKHPP